MSNCKQLRTVAIFIMLAGVLAIYPVTAYATDSSLAKDAFLRSLETADASSYAQGGQVGSEVPSAGSDLDLDLDMGAQERSGCTASVDCWEELQPHARARPIATRIVAP